MWRRFPIPLIGTKSLRRNRGLEKVLGMTN
jgi:hypothetical protein